MALSCIDWEPDARPRSSHRPRVLHITKSPPSNSGIARHSVPFDRALDTFAERRTIGLAVDAVETQRLGVTARLARDSVALLRRERFDLVVIDLSGRALAEFYAACLIASMPRRWRPAIWLVIHDAPDLVGPCFLFTPLDRKGGRRIGMALSGSLGGRIEQWLVRRASAVIAFSVLGADAMHDRFGHPRSRAVPLPSELLAGSVPREPIVYCPAGVSAADIVPVVAAFGEGELAGSSTLIVGNLPASERAEVVDRCRSAGIESSLGFTGFLDQDQLDHSFARASVAVRHHRSEGPSANWAAASGPVVSALAAGCALVSTDRRGSARCVELAGSYVGSSSERDLVREIVRVASDGEVQRELSDRATAHVRDHHVPEAVGRCLAHLWEESRGRPRVPGGQVGRTT